MIYSTIIYFLGVIFYCFPSLLFSQSQQIKFEHISLEQGLSQAAVNAIVQDDLGFMWFGTLDGLNRYDGYEIKVYKHDPLDLTSISHNKIMALYVDRMGILWIGTDGGGLNKFNYQTETFKCYRNDISNPNSLSSNNIRSIYEDSNGVLWIGSFAIGVDRFFPGTESFIHFPIQTVVSDNPIENCVISIYEPPNSDGKILWMGTYGGGLVKFDIETKSYKHYRHDPANPNSLSHNIVWFVCGNVVGKESELWVGTYGGGINQFNPETGIFKRYSFDPNNSSSLSNDYVTSIYPSPYDKTKLWISTEDGLNMFDTTTKEFINYKHTASNTHSLSSSRIRSIFYDRGGTMWFGTMGGGINKYSPGRFRFLHYNQEPDNLNSLNNNFIRSIYEGRTGVLWVGTGTGGLNKIEFVHDRVLHFTHDPFDQNSLNNNSVRAVYEDNYGIVWLGTEGGGLDRLDPLTGHFTHFRYSPDKQNSLSGNNVWVIYEDPADENVLWLGTYGGGLNKVILSSEKNNSGSTIRKPVQFIHYKYNPSDSNSLSNDKVLAICNDRQLGKLWIGTADGLNLFNKSTNKFTRYKNDPTNPNNLSNNTVTSIHQDKYGMLWVGTFGGGLNRFDSNSGSFQHFTEKHGLPNNNVNGILEDDGGNLWISTYNGLTKYNPQTETFRNFNISDGLQSNEFGYGAYHRNKSGRMYFGGINGFNVFNPDSIRINPYVPPVVITEFQVFNKSVPLAGE